ncbi:hypothetical protein GCM10022275_31230 [Tessaracoccus defluvii]
MCFAKHIIPSQGHFRYLRPLQSTHRHESTRLGPLDRASRLPLKQPGLNTANRAFVRHLLGRDAEALSLLESIQAPEADVFVWREPECGSLSLRSMQLPVYVDDLHQHITSRLAATAN